MFEQIADILRRSQFREVMIFVFRWTSKNKTMFKKENNEPRKKSQVRRFFLATLSVVLLKSLSFNFSDRYRQATNMFSIAIHPFWKQISIRNAFQFVSFFSQLSKWFFFSPSCISFWLFELRQSKRTAKPVSKVNLRLRNEIERKICRTENWLICSIKKTGYSP